MKEFPGITSVLIPLFNHEQFITAALDSLLQSDCKKVELILCDDASTDQSFAVAKDWIDHHGSQFFSAKLLANEKNQGITSNLNKLVKASSGEFITLLASDDMLTKGAIDIQRNFLTLHQDVDFVFANCAIIDTNEKIIKPEVIQDLKAKFLNYKFIILLDSIFNWGIIWARFFARRKAFIEFGEYIENHIIEDRWSALKILNTKRYKYLHQIVYLYRFRGLPGHPAISSDLARKSFHDAERRLHPETTGVLSLLLYIRRLPFKTNRGKWPCRLH